MAIRWASGRSPTTTTSPALKPSGSDSVDIGQHPDAAGTSPSAAPTSCSPSSTSVMAPRWSARRAATPRATRGRSGAPARARSRRRPARRRRRPRARGRSSSRPMSSPASRTGSRWPASGNRSRMTSRDPQQHVRQELGLRRAAALEHPARLGVQLAEPDRHVLVARIDPPLELGVADRGRDRVRVRVAVPGDVDARHARIMPCRRAAGSSSCAASSISLWRHSAAR